MTTPGQSPVTRAWRTQAVTGRTLAIAAAGLFACWGALPVAAQAGPLIQNGDFSLTQNISSPGGYICQVGTTCTSNVIDWGSTCDAASCGTSRTVASLLYANTNGSGFNGNRGLWGPIANSPDGGNYIAIDGDPTYTASLFQQVSGLTIGDDYILTFFQAAAQQNGTTGATTEQWKVQFGSATQYSTVMDNASHGFVPWNTVTMTFRATAASELLTFFALGTPGGEPPVVLLDGVTFQVPEPGSIAIAAAGLLALAVARKRLRQA